MYTYHGPTPFIYNITFVPHNDDVEATRVDLMAGLDIQVHTCEYEMPILDVIELHDFGGIKHESLKFQYFRKKKELTLGNIVGEVANIARTTGSYAPVHCGDLDNRLTIVITYTRKALKNRASGSRSKRAE
ncbi:hypothetical protein IWW57_005427 [Coemansia sp. S610]|nr:hypothetical protein IWW57_005427 [Coemansia sp. S610]KAJ2698961.1 hypothetical protein H4218_002948 [Coemansia sp. IMI 209128]